MPVPTNIKFKDFIKAVQFIAENEGYKCVVTSKTGSAIRFDLFKNGNLKDFWTVHEDKKEKKVYSKDLKKACDTLGIDKKIFEDVIRNKFKSY